MFSILRFILIIGAIFYYSPVRQKGEGKTVIDALLPARKPDPAAVTKAPPAAEQPAVKLESVWQVLPEGAKQAVIDKIMTTSGLTASGPSADTLNAGDRKPAWRGAGSEPRS